MGLRVVLWESLSRVREEALGVVVEVRVGVKEWEEVCVKEREEVAEDEQAEWAMLPYRLHLKAVPDDRQHAAARAIQAPWLQQQRREKALVKQRQAVRRHEAAMVIQNAWMRLLSRRRIRHKAGLHSAAMDVQCMARALLSAQAMALRRQVHGRRVAAMQQVQGACFSILAAQRTTALRMQRQQQRSLAPLVQAYARAWVAAIAVSRQRWQAAASLQATRLQAACRARLASAAVVRLRHSRQAKHLLLKVTIVQAACRARAAAAAVTALAGHRQTQRSQYTRLTQVTTIQSACRAQLAALTIRLLVHHRQAQQAQYIQQVTLVQAACRARLASTATAALPYRRWALETVAQAFRTHHSRWVATSLSMHAAACRVQSHCRGLRAAQLVHVVAQHQRQAAALHIQRRWRGFACRVRLDAYQRFLAYLGEQAVRIQSAWRGHTARCCLSPMLEPTPSSAPAAIPGPQHTSFSPERRSSKDGDGSYFQQLKGLPPPAPVPGDIPAPTSPRLVGAAPLDARRQPPRYPQLEPRASSRSRSRSRSRSQSLSRLDMTRSLLDSTTVARGQDLRRLVQEALSCTRDMVAMEARRPVRARPPAPDSKHPPGLEGSSRKALLQGTRKHSPNPGTPYMDAESTYLDSRRRAPPHPERGADRLLRAPQAESGRTRPGDRPVHHLHNPQRRAASATPSRPRPWSGISHAKPRDKTWTNVEPLSRKPLRPASALAVLSTATVGAGADENSGLAGSLYDPGLQLEMLSQSQACIRHTFSTMARIQSAQPRYAAFVV
uniref:Uncharacterized protein n=1 Tax=Eutreptiella gymnastica TaxID=73025 RepID=A0A7S1IGG8_9EUGL